MSRVRALLTRPEATIPILDALYRDDSASVRRSVANHLNDLSRISPAQAVGVAASRLADPAPTTEPLVRHGLRTLVTQADPAALGLLGHPPAHEVRIDGPQLGSTEVAGTGHRPGGLRRFLGVAHPGSPGLPTGCEDAQSWSCNTRRGAASTDLRSLLGE